MVGLPSGNLKIAMENGPLLVIYGNYSDLMGFL